MKAMCVELGRQVQGYGNTKVTDTIKFMTLNEIAKIPAYRTMTYSRIVVDYRKQKIDSNRLRIKVGEI